jgi:hypothetical protein
MQKRGANALLSSGILRPLPPRAPALSVFTAPQLPPRLTRCGQQARPIGCSTVNPPCPVVQPDNGVVQGLASAAAPDKGGLSLVGDAQPQNLHTHAKHGVAHPSPADTQSSPWSPSSTQADMQRVLVVAPPRAPAAPLRAPAAPPRAPVCGRQLQNHAPLYIIQGGAGGGGWTKNQGLLLEVPSQAGIKASAWVAAQSSQLSYQLCHWFALHS